MAECSLKLFPNILVLQLAPYRDLKVFFTKFDGFRTVQGQGHKTTAAADDRYVTRIVVTSRRNRLISAPKLTKQFHVTSGIHVSTHTIWNRLQKRDLRGRRPYNYAYGQPRSCAFELGNGAP